MCADCGLTRSDTKVFLLLSQSLPLTVPQVAVLHHDYEALSDEDPMAFSSDLLFAQPIAISVVL